MEKFLELPSGIRTFRYCPALNLARTPIGKRRVRMETSGAGVVRRNTRAVSVFRTGDPILSICLGRICRSVRGRERHIRTGPLSGRTNSLPC